MLSYTFSKFRKSYTPPAARIRVKAWSINDGDVLFFLQMNTDIQADPCIFLTVLRHKLMPIKNLWRWMVRNDRLEHIGLRNSNMRFLVFFANQLQPEHEDIWKWTWINCVWKTKHQCYLQHGWCWIFWLLRHWWHCHYKVGKNLVLSLTALICISSLSYTGCERYCRPIFEI